MADAQERPDSGAEAGEFIGVAPASGPHRAGGFAEQLSFVIDGSRLAVRNAQGKRAELEKDERLTPLGVDEGMQKYQREPLAHLQKLATTAQAYETRLGEAEGKLARDAFALDADGERFGPETRSMLRQLPPEERRRAFLDLPPGLQNSVLSAPSQLSGISHHLFDLLRAARLRETHGEQLAEVEQLREWVEAARGALQRAERVVRKVCAPRAAPVPFFAADTVPKAKGAAK